MAMRLADTFLVHRRSCFAILFSGQTPHWSLPRSFWDNADSLHRPVRTHPSSRFLTRMRFGLRSVGARAVRTVEGICAARARLDARGSESGHLTTPETGRPRSHSSTRDASFPIDIVSRIALLIRDILKTQICWTMRLGSTVRRVKRMTIEQMFVKIAYTSCKCEHSR